MVNSAWIAQVAKSEIHAMYATQGYVTKEVLDEAIAAAAEYVSERTKQEIPETDLVEATHLLEQAFVVHFGNDYSLVNNENHVPWFAAKKLTTEWSLWNDYRTWLVDFEHRPADLIDATVDKITDNILSYLEDPAREGKWSRRGLVAGQVQSGKTSNYIGLINKAIDVGYKLVIVLAGLHDDLRSQTQMRVNEGVLGFDTQQNFTGQNADKKVGVGTIRKNVALVNCPTSSDKKGDFNLRIAKGVGSIGGDPIILVIKKNKSILENLIQWASVHESIDPDSGRSIVKGVPVLLIDDEADYASIDTATKAGEEFDEETDPSTTNRLIRQLLNTFEKTAYIGYTATPFANIFINPTADHSEFGPDLFPKHFIVTLPENSHYSGASRVFGLVEDESSGIDFKRPLPTTREIDDFNVWMPDRHKKDWTPPSELPESLKDAIYSFYISTAIKKYRNTRMKHSSMLIHVTRFLDVQTKVKDQIQDFVDSNNLEIKYLNPVNDSSQTWEALKTIYFGDFIPSNEEMAEQEDLLEQIGQLPTWEELTKLLILVSEEIQVVRINGESKDSLMYSETPNGVTTIAVGGDKLSRGLTLEGLTISYYLRASKMYDTLLQMGRWFGYRPRYLDACRLFTSSQLVDWYTRITLASERLYKEFELMAALGKTPEDFGFKIQTHPDGLLVTAPNKARFSKKVKTTFSGTISETILFKRDPKVRESNWDALSNLYKTLTSNKFKKQENSNRQYFWSNVPSNLILQFLNEYNGHEGAVKALPSSLADYIRSCNMLSKPELTSWHVLISDKPSSSAKYPMSTENQLGLRTRTGSHRGNKNHSDENNFVIGRVVDPSDEKELLRIAPERLPSIHALLLSNPDNDLTEIDLPTLEEITARQERQSRSVDEGYLILYPIALNDDDELFSNSDVPYLGFGISFPESSKAPQVDYQVNEVFWDLEVIGLDND